MGSGYDESLGALSGGRLIARRVRHPGIQECRTIDPPVVIFHCQLIPAGPQKKLSCPKPPSPCMSVLTTMSLPSAAAVSLAKIPQLDRP
jgi:hypothetical protein